MTRLTVVGAGCMGAQIAQRAALHGVEVRLHDKSEEQPGKAVESPQLEAKVKAGKLGRKTGEGWYRH